MKIEFDAMGPERTEVEQMLNGWRYQVVLQDLDEYLKRQQEVEFSEKGQAWNDGWVDAVGSIREELHRFALAREVKVWD